MAQRLLCIAMLALPLVLSACATAPAMHSVDNTRTYNASYDEIWHKLMRFVTRKSLPLSVVEKASGVVYIKGLGFNGKQADCGSNPWALVVNRKASISVYVDKLTRLQTRVTVNTRLTQERVFGVLPPKVVQCHSTGRIERIILDAL